MLSAFSGEIRAGGEVVFFSLYCYFFEVFGEKRVGIIESKEEKRIERESIQRDKK